MPQSLLPTASPTTQAPNSPLDDPLNRYGHSVLAWPAWKRVAAVAPALALLWLAVCWAMVEVAPL